MLLGLKELVQSQCETDLGTLDCFFQCLITLVPDHTPFCGSLAVNSGSVSSRLWTFELLRSENWLGRWDGSVIAMW